MSKHKEVSLFEDEEFIIGSDDMKPIIKGLLDAFSKAFVNDNNEFIANPRTNTYFRLEDCNNKRDVIKKILHWVSRDCFITQMSEYHKGYLRTACNKFIGMNFTPYDWADIYINLGNGVNEKLTEEFIDSSYNVEIFKRRYKKEVLNK